MDQYYVDSSYWDDGYAGYQAQASIGSGLYIDENYFTPNDYYEARQGFATLTVEISKIKNAVATFTVEFTQTATISHIEGADLFAFTEAAIAAQVDRIRNNNIETSSVFSVATDVIRVRQGDADADAVFSAIINGLRSRNVNLDAQAAFSFECEATEITPFIEFESSVSSESTLDVTVGKITQSSSTINSSIELTATISHIEGADLTAFSDAAISAQAERTRNCQAQTDSEFDLQTTATRIQSALLDISSEASVSVSANASKNFSVSLQSTVEVTATISHIEGADLTAFGDAALSAVAERTRNADSNQSSEFTQTADIERYRYSNLTANSEFNVETQITKTTDYTASLDAEVVVSVVVDKFIQGNSSQTGSFQINANAVKTTDNGATVSGEFTVSALGQLFKDIVLTANDFASITAVPSVRVSSQSAIEVEATVNVDSNRFRNTESSQTASTDISGVGERFRNSIISTSSEFSLTAIIGKQQDIDLYAFSNNNLTADAVVIRDASTTLQVSATSSVTATRIPQIDIAISSQIGLTATNTRVKFASSSLSVDGAVLTVGDVVPVTQVILTSEFSTNKPYAEGDYVEDDYATNFLTLVNYIADISQNLTSTFTVFANIDVLVGGAALLANSGTLTASPVIIASASSNQQSEFTSETNANHKVVASSTLQSQFTVVANATTIRSGIFLTAFDNIQLTAVISKRVNVGSNINVSSTVFANVTKIKDNVVAISSALAFVVAIRDLRLDEIVYVIPGENYVYQIISETRLHDIYGETRIRSILGESRIRTITGESRIHIID